jgi:hypothetical protein
MSTTDSTGSGVRGRTGGEGAGTDGGRLGRNQWSAWSAAAPSCARGCGWRRSPDGGGLGSILCTSPTMGATWLGPEAAIFAPYLAFGPRSVDTGASTGPGSPPRPSRWSSRGFCRELKTACSAEAGHHSVLSSQGRGSAPQLGLTWVRIKPGIPRKSPRTKKKSPRTKKKFLTKLHR